MKTLAAKERTKSASPGVKRSTFSILRTFVNRQQQAEIRQIVQPKLTVGPANDKYEQEAERVADTVVAGQSVADISPVSAGEIASASRMTLADEPAVQRQSEEEEEEPVQARSAQRESEVEEEKEAAQRSFLQRQADDQEEEEAIQALRIQRLTAEEEEETVQARGAEGIDSGFVLDRQSAGAPLRPDVRGKLEAGIGADLGDVRVHEDGNARAASAAINAHAFTHGNHIWLGEGQAQSNLHLMAHEATHVVQQRGGSKNSRRAVSAATPRVQRLWNPINAISNAVNSAREWVGETVGQAVDYVKERAVAFVSEMPGYTLFTVVNGSDPVTGRRVERNGRNFIEAGLDIIPNGAALKQKLEQEGALEEAAQWLDNQLRELDFSPSEIAGQFSRFWSGLAIEDAMRLPTVMNRLAGIILGPIARITRFAVNVASQLLRIVKRYVSTALIAFIREHTNAYPLLTVILGRDPISNEPVERTPLALLRGFMQLSESGQEQLRQMEESGSLQRAVDWLDGAVTRLNITWEVIRETFTAAWDLVTIQNLLEPLAIFRQLFNLFAAPVGRIVNFVIEIAAKVLGFIKAALIGRLVAYARTVRGYPLVSVLLGKDPFSQAPVERNTPNIIRGFMSLMENGEQQYQEMAQSGAIARMGARVEAALALLNFTWEYVRGLFTRAWNSFSLQDLAAPLEAFARIMNLFAGPILRLVNFVGEIIKIVIEVLMEVMNFPIQLIRSIIARAMQAIGDIKRDPIGFLKNLLRAVKTGFQQFFSNILNHLISGLTGWLFSELRDANINPPADLSFRSILGFALEVLGITVERIWQKLAERLGPERVNRIRGMIDRLTGIWSFVRDVATRGPVAIWEYIQDRLSNLWSTVLEAVRNWVVTRIIERVTVRLLSMLDPTGIMAVINGFIAFYNAVQSFIRYLREMLEIVNSFVGGVAEIARGSVVSAANFLEGAMAQGMPVAIGFLANQVGLSGIGRRIGEMIERVRETVDRALTWLVDRAVSAGSAVLNSIGRALGLGGRQQAPTADEASGEGDWRNERGEYTEDGHDHHVTYNGTTILIASDNPDTIQNWLRQREQGDPNYPAEKRAIVMGVIQQSIPELNQLKNDYESARSSQDNASMRASKRAIDDKLQEIADRLVNADLFPELEFTDPEYGPRYNGEFGTQARVEKLALGHSAGSDADSSLFNDSYESLNLRKQGARSFYVRGHLLNARLGGPGRGADSWKNLTPLFQNANSDHERKFEGPVKRAVRGEGYARPQQVKDFQVTAHYGRSLSPHVAILEDLTSDAIPGGMDPDIDPLKMAALLRAEVNVPYKLECSAKLEDGPPLSEPVDNRISYGTLSSYQMTQQQSRQEFRLGEKLNSADPIAALMALNGVDQTIAQRIVDRLSSNRRITDYYRQIGISKKQLETLNSDKRIRQ